MMVTVSGDAFEPWDLVRFKRLKLTVTPYGLITHGCVVGTKFVSSEDSRMLRVFGNKRYESRIYTNHNDCIRQVIKIKDVPVIITGSDDGAIKFHSIVKSSVAYDLYEELPFGYRY